MKTDLLADRHIGIQEADLPAMLEKIGVKSLDELINKTIPSKIRLKEPLALAAPMTEREFAEHIAGLASLNKIYTSYIGMGWYDTITPAVIQRNVFENPAWYTSYTPYQTEVSQGRLEALLNFQTVISDLTAMPLANCSLLDEATAAAEAATMMYGLRSRDQQKKGTNVLFVDESIFPQNLAVIQTRVIPQGMKIQVGNYKELEFTPEIFACIIQYPNASGSVEDYREFVEKAHAANCKVAVDADILSLPTPPPDSFPCPASRADREEGVSWNTVWGVTAVSYPSTNVENTPDWGARTEEVEEEVCCFRAAYWLFRSLSFWVSSSDPRPLP